MSVPGEGAMMAFDPGRTLLLPISHACYGLEGCLQAGTFVEIHKPKPVHSWRELLSEVGVVVIGIVIALSLEEGLRALHDRGIASEAREAVKDEIRQNLSFMSGRLEMQPCVERRLDEIGSLLEASRDGELKARPNWVGQPSVYFLSNQRWQAAAGSGRVSLLTTDEQGRLGVFPVLNARFNDAEAREQAAWSQLRGLETWQGRLGSDGRIHFAAALQDARYELWETRITIGLALRLGERLGIKPDMPKTMDNKYVVPHAICLPISTTREQALKILSQDGSPPWGQPK